MLFALAWISLSLRWLDNPPPPPSTLFVSPLSRAISKNAVSYFLQEVILGVGPVREMKALPCEFTEFEGCPPLLYFCKLVGFSGAGSGNFESNSVFASFYFHDIQFV